MSAPKHTPEPWKHNGPGITAEHGFSVAMTDDYAKTREAQIANAARIVACVNALAGIESPAEWVAKAKEALNGRN